jgi:TetR/AcrR family transcriptional repressor of nem operon
MSTQKVDPLIIAEKASDLFVRRGYTNTSMSEIGQSCGILKGSLYHHFDSKEHILLYILEQLRSDLRKYVFSIADNTDQSELQRLQNINGFLKDYFLDKRACLIAMMGMEAELICEEAREMMGSIFMDWKKTYVKLFRKHYSPYMAEIHATNAIVFIEGAMIWMRVTQEDEPLRRAFKNIEKNLLPAEETVK